MQIKFQYLIELNYKFQYQKMCLQDEKVLILNCFNFKKHSEDYHFNKYLCFYNYLYFQKQIH